MATPIWYPKARTAMNKRLEAEGRYDAYREMLEGYKKAGVMDKYAWQVAALSFQPLSPDAKLEFEPEETALDLFEQMGPLNTSNPPALEVVHKNFTRTNRGGTEETQDALLPVSKRRSSWEEIAKEVPLDRKAQPLEIAQWCFQRYMTPIEQIDPDEVPDQGALGLLRHIRATSTSYTDFIRNLWAKLIPDRRAIEASARFADDGREILNDLDAFDKEFEGEESEEAA